MHDSDFLEKEAELKIASELLRYEIIVAKPKVDKLGADLLAMLRVDDGAHFIRVQSKGRSLEKRKSCHIEIPKNYVTESFVCFLYLRQPSVSGVILSVFFSDDILSWTINRKDEYTFSVSVGSYQEKLKPYKFNGEKVKRLIEVIQIADIEKQFNLLINLSSHSQYPDIENTKIVVEQKYGIQWDTTIHDKATGIEITGTPCPGDPEDFIYNQAIDTWIAK